MYVLHHRSTEVTFKSNAYVFCKGIHPYMDVLLPQKHPYTLYHPLSYIPCYYYGVGSLNPCNFLQMTGQGIDQTRQ